MKKLTNLTNHLFERHVYSREAMDLGNIVNQIVLASKVISREVNKAGLVDILGETGKINIQNEEVKKLDEYANESFVEYLYQSPYVKAVGSEEIDNMIVFNDSLHKDSKYIVHIDPLDGSSNIDVNVSIGTNFVVFKKVSKGNDVLKRDYLQPGRQAVCAGYVLYGSSTMLVYSSGKGVYGFTLDPSIGEFVLSHDKIEFPQSGGIYSINESYEPHWTDHLKNYLAEVKSDMDVSGKAKTSRYIGSLVADFHRNLLKGGIFLYPADKKNTNGKLRLLYEGIPFAFLASQAKGYASNGKVNVLDIVPDELHQRIPFFVGCKKDVKRLEKFIA